MSRVDFGVGLIVDSVRVDTPSLEIQTHPIDFEMPEPGRIEVVVLEADLAAFLEAKAPGGLTDFSIRFEDDLVHVDAIKNLFVDLKVRATCAVRVEAKTQIFVDLNSVDVLGAGVKQLVQTQLDKLNPIIDLAELPFEIFIHEVTSSDGKLVLRGEASAAGVSSLG